MLEVAELACGYGDLLVVQALSFDVADGEIFGLIGPNGAGKTSTLTALAGINPPVAGRVWVNGRDITLMPAHRRVHEGIAWVPEGRRVFSDLSVDENLAVGATRLGLKALERNREQVFELFPRLAERRRQRAGSLSGGEQQMLAIGRAIMASPSLLLVDELSLGLMPLMVDECYRALAELKRAGLSILLVEQSTDRVLEAADRIAVLESGRLAWTGTGAEAMRNADLVEAYLGLA